MPIKFYHSCASPPSRSVHMTFKALDLEVDIEEINLLAYDQKKPELMKINPFGLIPIIIDGDLSLSESRAIATYLCSKYAKDDKVTLYPSEVHARAVVEMALSRVDWVYKIVYDYLNLHDAFFHGHNMRNERLPKVEETLQVMDDLLEKTGYLAGDHMTIADIFGVIAVLTLDFCAYTGYSKFPNLYSWIGEVKSLPYFDECNKEGMEAGAYVFLEKMKQYK